MSKVLTEQHIRLLNIFLDRYQKLTDPDHPEKQILTTRQIFTLLQSLWPSEDYTAQDVYDILSYADITGFTGDSQNYFWMLQPAER